MLNLHCATMSLVKNKDIPYTNETKAQYNHFGIYLREKFQNRRIFKISIDAGFTCPNRDGAKGFGGCYYCNVDSFTPPSVRKKPSIKEQVKLETKKMTDLYKAEAFIAYFQPNTNTYAPVSTLKQIYDEALDALGDKGVGLSIGTRIDCLDEDKICLIESYAKNYEVTLELGLESIYEETLKRINRGHSVRDFLDGMERLKRRSFKIGIHTIFGFPWETREMQLTVADFLNELDFDFLKLHQLHVTKSSVLEKHFKENPFPLYSLETYASFLEDFLPRLKPTVIIERLFATAYPRELVAPQWNKSKSFIQSYLEEYLKEKKVAQGDAYCARL